MNEATGQTVAEENWKILRVEFTRGEAEDFANMYRQTYHRRCRVAERTVSAFGVSREVYVVVADQAR